MEHAVEERVRAEPFSKAPERVTRRSKLSASARLLYMTYKAICGEKEDGACWMTMRTLEKESGLSANTITRARRELEVAELITVKQRRRPGEVGHRLVVRVVSIWKPKEVGADSAAGGLRQGSPSPCTSVQSDAPIANLATRPSQILRRNKNTLNKNTLLRSTSTSSSSSSLKGSQTAIMRRDASSEGDPLGDIPSGGNNSGAETMHNRFKSSQGAGMQGLDLTDDSTKKSPPTETYDEKAASRLIEAVAKKLRILRRPRLDVWATDIAKFRRINQVSEEDFEDRLSWYIDHIDDEYVPIVHSAKSFCEKIDQIGAVELRSRKPVKGKRTVADQLAELKKEGIIP